MNPGDALNWSNGQFVPGNGTALGNAAAQGLRDAAAGLSKVGEAAGSAAKVFNAYSVGQNVGDAFNAYSTGNVTGGDEACARALTTLTCMAPYVSGCCALGVAAKVITGKDPVEESFNAAWKEVVKTVRENPDAFGSMECMGAVDIAQCESMRTWAQDDSKRQQLQRDFDQVQDQNIQAAAAAAAAAAVNQAPAPPPDPSPDFLNPSLRLPIPPTVPTRTETAAAACRPAKVLDPKTGCHYGHDEKAHPGGCKCG